MVQLDRAAADLTRPDICAAQIQKLKPSVVLNTAAYTDVDQAEKEEALALSANASAPEAMGKACADMAIPFCHLSTDYVFSGSGSKPHAPGDPTNPLNAYGRTKLAGEDAIRAAGGTHVILRTSWVFSEYGRNFLKTIIRISGDRTMLKIVGDQMGGPTPARSIASTLLTLADALRDGQRGGTYHYSGAPDVSRADFARDILAAANRPVGVTKVDTSEYQTPAKRPLNSRLDCTSLCAEFGIERPSWQAEIGRILKDLR